MAEFRAEWQKFKKKYPDFDKAKGVKADVGPSMDQYAKRVLEVVSLAKSIQERLKKVGEADVSIDKVLTRYYDLVAEIAHRMEEQGQGRPKIQKAANELRDSFNSVSKIVSDKAETVKRDVRRAYKNASNYNAKDWDLG